MKIVDLCISCQDTNCCHIIDNMKLAFVLVIMEISHL